MSDNPRCPKCDSEYVYEDGSLHVCPECAHEWPIGASAENTDGLVVRDVHGNILSDGDSVTVIKDLKVKGTSSVVKVGTKATSGSSRAITTSTARSTALVPCRSSRSS